MSVLTGPLFSIAARGSLARTIEYVSTKRGTAARRWKQPRNPDTPAQRSIRSANRFLTDQWNVVSATDRETFIAPAEIAHIAPYHAYLSQNMTRWIVQRSPAQIHPASEDDTLPVLTFDSLIPYASGTGFSLFAFFIFNDMWASTIYMRMDNTPPTRADVARLQLINMANGWWAIFHPMPPGTYFLWHRSFTRTGKQTAMSGPKSITIP